MHPQVWSGLWHGVYASPAANETQHCSLDLGGGALLAALALANPGSFFVLLGAWAGPHAIDFLAGASPGGARMSAEAQQSLQRHVHRVHMMAWQQCACRSSLRSSLRSNQPPSEHVWHRN